MGALRPTVAVAVLLGTASCGSGAAGGVTGATSSPTASTVVPAAVEGLVLRVEYTGGFLTPPMLAGRLPIVSVYADGRMITEGPVAAIYPGPALPDVQVQTIEAGAVQDLVDRAVAAGVGATSDLGTPPVADATSTRFTVVTADGTLVREAYALWETPMEGSGLTAEQDAARAKLAALLSALTEETTEGSGTQAYEPDAIGAIVSPWADPGDGLPQHEVAWPGPALPGEPTGGPMDISCVVAAGAQARAILDAAGAATAATPWVTPEGTRWSVTFRPLLPDESGCADLVAD